MAFNMNKTFMLLILQNTAQIIAGVTFTINPSNDIEVNQEMTLECVIGPNPTPPILVYFTNNKTDLCSLGPSNGTCQHSCLYNVSCPSGSESVYSLQLLADRNWNGLYFFCKTLYKTSEPVLLSVKVPVTSVTLNPTSIMVTAGKQMNLTCTSSYCNPAADIKWYISPSDVTDHSTFTRNTYMGLVRTVSSLSINVEKSDNGKQVYCTARNTPSKTLKSTEHTLTVLYAPEVNSFTTNPYRVTEGQEALLDCTLIAANPNNSISWKWFIEGSPENVLNDGPTYKIQNIKREISGVYICTANNSIGTSVPVTINVDVQYKPEITSTKDSLYRVIEGQNITLDCVLTAANPNTSIEWTWYNSNNTKNVIKRRPIYTIFNIQRNNTGTYSCSASNIIGTSVPVSIDVDVQFKPEIKSLTPSPYRVIEGRRASLECSVMTANPNTNITWRWFKTDRPEHALHTGPNYTIQNVGRMESGTYNCTASNSVGFSVPVKVDLDVQYKPKIMDKPSTVVNESDRVILNREVVGNPLSDVSWYYGSDLLDTQLSVRNATFIVEKALCTDTKNFTLVASNSVERNVTVMVELIVNCKPRAFERYITLGVTDTSGIDFSIPVIAYPEPLYQLQYGNGTKKDQITHSISRNAVFNFTIHFNQTVVKQHDYGTYYLILQNAYGEANVSVNVIPQRKPDMAIITDYVCEVETARIEWESSFNGGDRQSFTVVALIENQIENKTDTISDKGKNIIHSTFVQNLQSSTTYVFSVAAHNKHGFSLSKNISCTTLEEEGVHLPLIAGGAVAGGITLAIIVIVIVLMFRRYKKNEERAGKPQRLEDELVENRDTDDDGLKENILYVSADTRDTEKNESAVYAAVNKIPQESHNNANVYAEVNKSEPKIREGALYSDVKPKKGFFKKNEQDKVGGKPKQRKGKKQKTKQEIADVYENSEDIAMTPNVDNVYSNSEHKNLSETKQRGYKNKDGLLYVEVNFDGKQGQDNPVIHGEDEKTDYATVEFPMPSALHKASGSEEL